MIPQTACLYERFPHNFSEPSRAKREPESIARAVARSVLAAVSRQSSIKSNRGEKLQR